MWLSYKGHLKFHTTKAMWGGGRKNQSFICFFQRLGKKPGVIFLQLRMCVCWGIFPHLSHHQGSSSCFTFKGREGITLTPTGKRKMPLCNSPPGNRNKEITYACIMEGLLTHTRQKTSLFFTRQSLVPLTFRSQAGLALCCCFVVVNIKPWDELSKKVIVCTVFHQFTQKHAQHSQIFH